MGLKKIISLSLALLTGISVIPMQLFAASGGKNFTIDEDGKPIVPWSNPGTSSVISQGDIYYLEKNGSSVYPEKYTFKADGSDGDGIPTNSQNVMQDGEKKPIVPPWEQFYDGLSEEEKKERILVRDKITLTKKDKNGNPLKDIVFKIDEKEVCKTDEDGKCTIIFTDNKWGPIDLVERPIKYGNDRQKYNDKTIKLYRDPGTRFLGEVTGKKLGIEYGYLREEVINKASKNVKSEITNPSIKRSQSELIYDQNKYEEDNGGIWLKFIDRDQFGKIHVFYIAKKPILNHIYWSDIYKAGMVYGWDIIDPHTKKPRANLTQSDVKALKYYTPTIKIINSNKYIIRLPRGISNYGDSTTKERGYYYNDNAQNSEWNRTMVAITKQYRGQVNSMEQALRDGNSGSEIVVEGNSGIGWVENDYKNQTARYNWFGDLTLGAERTFIYNNNDVINVMGQGQWSLMQEYTDPGFRYVRGSFTLSGGAAELSARYPYSRYSSFGFRPVLEVVPKEYDGVVFEGEVTGNELGITYQSLRNEIKERTGEIFSMPSIRRTQSQLIYDLNKYEKVNGGIWLKFTDYKYKRKNTETDIEEPRTFYVAKKPILKNISWNDIHSAGMVYGWDVINPDTGFPKSDPENYQNNGNSYKACTKKVSGKKYIVRLLQGKTNYGGDVTKNKIYEYENDNNNSEWNRVILPLVQGYRFGSGINNNNYAEDILRKSDGNINYYSRKYTNNTAQYNWFGDLTLGAWDKFQYGGKTIDNSDNGTGSNGQWNWTQEYANSSGFRSIRGHGNSGSGAAYSYWGYVNDSDSSMGFRPVLEPLNN